MAYLIRRFTLVLGAIVILCLMSLYVYEKYEEYEQARARALLEKELSDVIGKFEEIKVPYYLTPKRSLEALDAFRKAADNTHLERAQAALENERQARRKFAAFTFEDEKQEEADARAKNEDKRYTTYNMSDYPRKRFEDEFPSLRGIRAKYSTQPLTMDDFLKADWSLVREWMYALLQRTDFSTQEKAEWVNKYFDTT